VPRQLVLAAWLLSAGATLKPWNSEQYMEATEENEIVTGDKIVT
jgi:hypothetical protein